MSLKKIMKNAAFKDQKSIELNEEWNNFVTRMSHVGNLVRDLASGDKEKADAAKILADQYLEGKVIKDGDIELKLKEDRTVINQNAFRTTASTEEGTVDKEAWMAEMSKDADRRALDRKIRREKAETQKTIAVKAFRRGDYEKALSYYNRAIEHVRDNPMLYCDRALTNIKLGKFEKVFDDCDLALRLNEKSFKARLYKAKAYKELEDIDKLEECTKELHEQFPQHEDLIKYFLDKKEELEEED